MDLTLSSETADFVAALDALLSKESSATRVRTAEPLGFDAKVWASLNALGLPALALDAETASDELLCAIAETAGVHLVAAPVVETLVTAGLLAQCGSSAVELAARVSDGAIATLVLTATTQPHPTTQPHSALVPAGAVADIVLSFNGAELIATAAPAPMAAVANVASLPLADRNLEDGQRYILADGEQARLLFERAQRQWKLLTASTLVGICAKALEIAVEYVRGRVIFDRPVATFQTVAHRLADHATDLDGARLLVQEAAWAGDIDSVRANALATMAFCFIGDRAPGLVGDAVHYHGGYGFTLEYDIQLYYRRACAYPLVWGSVAQEWQALADQLYGAAS